MVTVGKVMRTINLSGSEVRAQRINFGTIVIGAYRNDKAVAEFTFEEVSEGQFVCTDVTHQLVNGWQFDTAENTFDYLMR